MTLNAIRSVIEGRIATEFATAPVVAVSYQNLHFDPPNNQSWIHADILWGDSAYLTVLTESDRGTGDGFDRRNGTLTFSIYTPKNQGIGSAYTLAQRCIDLFSRLQIQNIKFDAANGPRVIQAGITESGVSAGSALAASYNETQVAITFEAYEQS